MSFKLKFILLKRKIPFFLHLILMFLFSMLFNKHFEMLLFIISYKAISTCFTKQFHADTLFDDDSARANNLCKIITIIVELIYLYMCRKYNLSIYSNVFLIILISVFSGLIQFFLERNIVKPSKLTNRESLEALCLEANLSKEATKRMILRYVDKMSIKEIAKLEFVEEETIKQSIRRSKRKINL